MGCLRAITKKVGKNTQARAWLAVACGNISDHTSFAGWLSPWIIAIMGQNQGQFDSGGVGASCEHRVNTR